MKVKDQKYNVAIDTACGGKVSVHHKMLAYDGLNDLDVQKDNHPPNHADLYNK